MESTEQIHDILTELKKMRLKRSDESQFSSKAAFQEWADVVDALLANYPDVRNTFRAKVDRVESCYRLRIPAADAENDAIGVLNKHVLALDLNPVVQSDVAKQPAGNHANKHAGGLRDVPPPTAYPWFQRPVGYVLLSAVAGLLATYIATKFG
ncbi:hypothetical protein [Janthinobacterium sp. PSPC3-1]|uniref:hypothetical protein n=1 Tax=Janthinobacterium sp. PSPC3-1 TaxID=2804653 RepID=UPI003CEF1DB4